MVAGKREPWQCSSAAAPAGRDTAAVLCKAWDKNDYVRGDGSAALVQRARGSGLSLLLSGGVIGSTGCRAV